MLLEKQLVPSNNKDGADVKELKEQVLPFVLLFVFL